MDEKVLLDVQINAQEALESYETLRKRIDVLRTSLKDLEKAGLKGSQLYAKTEQEIKALSARMATYNKEIQNSIKRDNEKEGSLQQLKARLSLLTAEYNKLSRDERNAKEGMEMGKEIASLTKELTDAEKALGNFRRQVGHYEVVAEQLGRDMDGLTKTLIDMRLEGKQDTEEYKKMAAELERLNREAQKVNDAIGVVNEQMAGTDFESSLTALNQNLTMLSNATKELNIGVPALQQGISAITTATTLWAISTSVKNGLEKNALIAQKIAIAQNKFEERSIVSKTKMQNASNIATKSATALQWLFNAAMAANPVFLVIAGITGLIAIINSLVKKFGPLARAQEDAAKASEDYANTEQKTSEKLAKLDADRERRANEISNAMRREILTMKARGATEKEIAEYKLKKEREIRDVEVESAKVRQAETDKLIKAKQKEIEKNEKYLKKLKEGKDEYKEQKKKIDEMRKSLLELNNTRDAEIQKIEDLALKNAEAEQQAREKLKEERKKEVDSRLKHEQKMAEESLSAQQKAEDARLKQENASQAELFAAKQKWEAERFDLSVEYQRKSLELQKASGDIFKKEYERQMAEIAASISTFYSSQALDAKNELLNAYNSVLAEVGESVTKQITIIDSKLANNLKTVAGQLGIDEDIIKRFEELQDIVENQRGPKGADMDELTEEQMSWYKSMEEQMFEYYRLEAELTRQSDEAKTAIETAGVEKRLERAFKAIEDENAMDLLDYSKTEEEKNNIRIAAAKKRLATLKEEEEKATDPKVRLELQKQIAEGEAEVHTLMLENMQIEADKELANASLTAKQKYDIELDYLNKRLEAVRGNAEAEMEVERKIAELQKQRNLEKIAAAEEYVNTTMDIAGKMNEVISGIEQRQLNEFTEANDEKKAALEKRLKDGIISQEQYDEQVASLDAELERKQKEIELKQAKREKAISIMQTIINTAMGIAKAVAENPMGGGLPGSAIMAAVGAAQLAAIVAQPLPKASRGMLLRGPSHAAGGIPIEAEGGEAIINKKATSRYLPLLSAINESTGGVSLYSRGGMVSRSRDEISMGIDYGKLAAACAQMNVQVAVTDINNGQARYAKVESLRSY